MEDKLKDSEFLYGDGDIPAGKHWCPNCKKIYTPTYPTKEAANQTMDREAREQWITGLCSTKCWKEHLGIDPDNYPENAE